jgi:hypothetical protein
MSLDEQGVLWIADPLVAVVAIVTAIGLLLWCHLCLAGADLEQPAAAAVRAHSAAAGPGPGRSTGGARPSDHLAGGRVARDVRRRRVA